MPQYFEASSNTFSDNEEELTDHEFRDKGVMENML